ncbi:MAG TPA: hypothetical protein VN753_05470 [Terracidiphilus sp.]|nr:hypothetical protein [Terracidiphilus sp.]
MTGKLPPDTENPAPEIESELMVTAAVPLDVSVTDFVTAVLTATFPNANEPVLRLRAALDAFSLIAKVFVDAFAAAVRLAVCAVPTAETFALKDAEDVPAATVTPAGTVTALTLLASVTL